MHGVTRMHKRHCEDSFTTTTDVVLHVITTLYDTLQCRRSRVTFPATEPHMVVIKVITLMYPEKYTGTEHFYLHIVTRDCAQFASMYATSFF